MNEEQVREIIRQEMRRFARELEPGGMGNHDAELAVRSVKDSLLETFPMSVTERAQHTREWFEWNGSYCYGYHLDDILRNLKLEPRRKPQNGRDKSEDDVSVRSRIDAHLVEVLGPEDTSLG